MLFGTAAVIVVDTWVTEALTLKSQPAVLATGALVLLMALPYLLLRLADDFAGLERWALPVAGAGLVTIAAGLIALRQPFPGLFVLLCVVYFVGAAIYAAAAFVQAARRYNGVTRRRMEAVAAGTSLLGLDLLFAGMQAAIPAWTGLWMALGATSALVSGVAYYSGFAPPRWLRRAWQDPEVRAFLSRTASMPRLPDTRSVVAALEEGAATSLGAARAVIGLWDETAQVLRYKGLDGEVVTPPNELIGGRAFSTQRPIFSADAERDDPEHAEAYRRGNARAILAAPITAGAVRLGVLAIYAARPPIFAEDDLTLVRLLADQAAVILESRALIDQAARVQAREEAARLKDDFLSSAAHDLKTPLTALVAQAQVMERRAERNPTAPPDLQAIQMMVKETQRLRRLVSDLLDGSRVEQRRLVGVRERVDLAELVRDACARHSSERNRCVLEAAAPVPADLDSVRMMQVIDNLLENAAQYSPEGGDIAVKVRAEDGVAHLTVTDTGIGIPPADLPLLFERFHRGLNVNDRHFAGLGLGLYICRGIVEEHGGRIWATSAGLGQGSSFHLRVPLSAGPVVRRAVSEQRALAGAAE